MDPMKSAMGIAGVIISGERHVSHGELLGRAAQVASGFRSLGCREGSSIALCLRNDFALFEASFGAALLGAYPVPVNWHFTIDEARYLITDCNAAVVVVHADLLVRLRDAFPPKAHVLVVETPPEIRQAYGIPVADCSIPEGMTAWEEWRDRYPPLPSRPNVLPSTMIYTSGTTGRPKGVRFAPATPDQIATRMRVTQRGFGFLDYVDSPQNIVAVLTGPMYHSAPNGYALHSARIGATLILQPRFDAEHLLELIDRRRVTHLHMVPVMFSRLLSLPAERRAAYDVSSLRFVVHAAAPCPPAVKRAMLDWWGPVINEYYGGTETSIVTSCTAEEWLAHVGTVGRPIPEAVLRVIDREGRDMPPDQAGEIACRIPGIADFTYHGDEAKRHEVDRAGLISLGDIGYLDRDGYLYVCDRSRDMIISGGVNIYPAEIEAELSRMPGVADCAVFGIPDDEFGEKVCAIIQPHSGVALQADDVREFLERRLAKYKLPRHIEFRTELPREDSGKLFKRKLRDAFWMHSGRQI
jgi:long-chain acyl-CoA synthetase